MIFIQLGHLFLRLSDVVSMEWGDAAAGSCGEGEHPWRLLVRMRDGTRHALHGDDAQTLLSEFKLPTTNPHPEGRKATEKAARAARDAEEAKNR